MLQFTNELTSFITTINEKKFIEIKNFASSLEANKSKAIESLRNEILLIEENSKKFIELAMQYKIKQTPTTIFRIIGNVKLACPLISEPIGAFKHPYKPCCINNVENWYFIAFPELNQVLPVSNIESLLSTLRTFKYTKIDENMFSHKTYESIQNSGFAVFPFTTDTWNKLQFSEKKKWPLILNQLRIGKVKLPIESTTFLNENALSVRPHEMGQQWALFVQLYFLLYLFKQVAGDEHFSF